MAYFVEDLIESIKKRSFAPISQSTFDDTAIIALINEELDLNVVGDLIAVREDFFLNFESTPVKSGISLYSVPSRAIGNTLKTLFYHDVSGNRTKLTLVDPSRRAEFELTAPSPTAYYFLGDQICLLPTPSVTQGSLHFQFPCKPNQLVATSSCAKITGISSTPTTASFTVNTDLTSSLSVGSYVDFLSVTSPFKLWAYKLPITQVTSGLIEVATAGVLDQAGVSITPQVNDYICPSGFANIAQIPTAFFPVLAQYANIRLLGSLGDGQKLNAAIAELKSLQTKAMRLVKNRVESTPKKVSTRRNLVRYFG